MGEMSITDWREQDLEVQTRQIMINFFLCLEAGTVALTQRNFILVYLDYLMQLHIAHH